MNDETFGMLRQSVIDAAADTPYTVVDTADGFDVTLDLADERWRTVLGRARLARHTTHEVRRRGDGITITDVVRSVSWAATGPVFSGSASVTRGRIRQVGFEKAWGLDSDGMPIKVADFRYSTQEGRDLVELAARQLGITQQRGASELIGLLAALITVGGLVVAGLVLLLIWVLGLL